MRYAKVVNNIVVNVIEDNKPLSAPWIQSDTAQIGYIYDQDTGIFQPAFAVQSRKIETTAFWKRVPIAKRLEIRTSTDVYVKEWMRLFDDPRLYEVDLDEPELVEALNYFASIGLLTTEQAGALRS